MSVKVNPITGIFHRLKRAWGRLTDSAAPAPAVQSYADWMRHFEPDAAALTAQREQAAQALAPLRFGFIYEGGDPADLQRLQRSLQAQTWPHWRLWCKQPALQPLGEPGPVQGVDYLARVAGGLELAPFALFAAAQAAASRPDALYADHDELVDGRRANPVFKPGWSPEMLLSSNYVQPLFWLRADLWERLQREVPGNLWAQALRAAEWNLTVQHIPQVLAHLILPQPADDLADVEEDLRRRGLDGVNAHREVPGLAHLIWSLPALARVSVIIPTRGSSPMLETCVRSILEQTAYPDYEVLLLNNGPQRPQEFPWFSAIQQDARVRVEHVDLQPFNYSRINNMGAHLAGGQYLLFLNNDTCVLHPEWMREMVQWASLPQIGAVGARLLHADGSIQHAGVIVGLTGFAGHVFAGLPADAHGIFGPVQAYRNTLAVTAACMMLRREVFEQAGGFNEEFILCGNDVELGLRLNRLGYRVMVNPFATLEHLESVTHQGNIPAQDFFTSYIHYHQVLQAGDPYFSPNLSYWQSAPDWRQPGEPAPLRFAQQHLESLKQRGLI